MASTLSSLIVVLGLDAADFQKGIEGADKSVGSFAARMQKIGSSMQNIGKTMTIGLTLPIVAFGASSVKSAMDAESALADLEAVLKSTGGAAGVTLDELTKNAAALQKVTKFSDEAVMSAQGMLLTFTNIGKDVFPSATEAALDMAEKFGMDASQAAITLGKALNDPIAGVGALRRIGVMLTDEQEAQIKSFMEVGDIASAQAIIMNELAIEIGGVARAAGDTAAGGFEQFKNQLDDMKEIVGTALIPVLIRLMEAVTPLIERFSNATPETQNLIITLLAVAAAAGPVITTIGGIVSAVGTLTPIITGLFTFITATAIPAIGMFIIANAAWILPLLLIAGTVYLVYLAFKNNFGGITTTVQNLWGIMMWAFGQISNVMMNIVTAIGNVAKSLTDGSYAFTLLFEDGSGALMDLAVAFGLPAKAVQDFLTMIYDLATSGGYAFTLLFEDGSGLLLDLATAFGIPEQAAQNFLTTVYDTFSRIMTTAKQLQAIFKFAFDGIVSAISKVIQKVVELAKALLSLILPKDLAPGSPTPFEMGLRGIKSAMDAISSSSLPKLNMGLGVTPSVASVGGSAAGGGNSSASNITINIENPKKETSEESITRLMKSLSYLGRIPGRIPE